MDFKIVKFETSLSVHKPPLGGWGFTFLRKTAVQKRAPYSPPSAIHSFQLVRFVTILTACLHIELLFPLHSPGHRSPIFLSPHLIFSLLYHSAVRLCRHSVCLLN